MNTDLDHAIRSVVADIVAAAPDVTDEPTAITVVPRSAVPAQRRVLAAAELLIAAGAVGAVLAGRSRPDPDPAPAAPSGAGPRSDPASPSPATTTTLAAGADAAAATDESACSDRQPEAAMPNVGGMPYTDAVDVMIAAGLDPRVAREAVSDGVQPELGAGHVIVSQDPTAGSPVGCGQVVWLTATTSPVYRVEQGDTWASIATARGIPVDDLLEFNDLTISELEAAGGSITSPLTTGQVIRLSLPYGSISFDEAPATTTTAG